MIVRTMDFHAVKLGMDDRPNLTEEIRGMLVQAAESEKKLAITIESVSGLNSFGFAFELFLYAESLFCNLLDNDWNEGNYNNEDVRSYDRAELELRLLLATIQKINPTFDFGLYTSSSYAIRFIGTYHKRLDHDALNAARALQAWMPEADRAPKSKEFWDSKIKEEKGA